MKQQLDSDSPSCRVCLFACFMYTGKKVTIFQLVDPDRTPSCYNVPIATHDPGPDGIMGTADDESRN